MGYTTDFFGEFKLSRVLTNDEKSYLDLFNEIRHVQLDEYSIAPTQLMENLNIPVGKDGCFHVDVEKHDYYSNPTVIDYNNPPGNCPGLWCGWKPNDSGDSIVWDGMEKFYNYTEWLNFIITNFLKPWKIDITGSVRFQGESVSDIGFVRIKDGVAIKDTSMNAFF